LTIRPAVLVGLGVRFESQAPGVKGAGLAVQLVRLGEEVQQAGEAVAGGAELHGLIVVYLAGEAVAPLASARATAGRRCTV
jgi:hypothetical protein